MIKIGFEYLDDRDIFNREIRKIFFIEKGGKDRVGDHWRGSLYYHPNFAVTILFNTESAYRNFCLKNEPFCFSDFDDYRQAYFVDMCEKVQADLRKCNLN